MTTPEQTTGAVNDPAFIQNTRAKALGAMRGFFGELMGPVIDALAKVKKILGGHEEVSAKTLKNVQAVMALRTQLNNPIPFEPKTASANGAPLEKPEPKKAA